LITVCMQGKHHASLKVTGFEIRPSAAVSSSFAASCLFVVSALDCRIL